MKYKFNDDFKVVVCDNCFQASCWQGEFMCDKAQGAGMVVKTVRELHNIGRENECYWKV